MTDDKKKTFANNYGKNCAVVDSEEETHIHLEAGAGVGIHGKQVRMTIVDDPGMDNEFWNKNPDLVKELMEKGRPLRRQTMPAANFWSQLMFATEWHRTEHQRLLAAGWQWDGTDGYYMPVGSPTGRSPSGPEPMRLPATQPVTGEVLTSKHALDTPEVDYSHIERRIAAYFQLGWDGKPVSK